MQLTFSLNVVTINYNHMEWEWGLHRNVIGIVTPTMYGLVMGRVKLRMEHPSRLSSHEHWIFWFSQNISSIRESTTFSSRKHRERKGRDIFPWLSWTLLFLCCWQYSLKDYFILHISAWPLRSVGEVLLQISPLTEVISAMASKRVFSTVVPQPWNALAPSLDVFKRVWKQNYIGRILL